MGPSKIHAAVRAMEPLSSNLMADDVSLLDASLAFVEAMVNACSHYELAQAYLNVFLTMHMGVVMGNEKLTRRAGKLAEAVGLSWEHLDTKMQRVMCMLGHFLRLQT